MLLRNIELSCSVLNVNKMDIKFVFFLNKDGNFIKTKGVNMIHPVGVEFEQN
jgi:hypothetical protein